MVLWNAFTKMLVSASFGALVLYAGLVLLAGWAADREIQELRATPLSWSQTADVKTIGWVKGDQSQRTIRYKIHNRVDNTLDLSPSLRLK